MKQATRPTKALRPAGRLHRIPSAVRHMVGFVLLVAAAGMIASAAVDLLLGAEAFRPLLWSAAVVGLPGLVLWGVTSPPTRPSRSSVFGAVLASWLALSIAAAVPYILAGTVVTVDDALVEAVSGVTATGHTVLRGIQDHPAGILFWRALTQWIGAAGIVVLALSVLPVLGVAGMELLRAETPGPTADRISPRVAGTARSIITFYTALTIAVAAGYALAGMSIFDAVTHSFTTVSTAGFANYDASLAYFDSAAVEWVAVAGMFIASGSFALYLRALRGRSLSGLIVSAEFRAFAFIMFAVNAIAVAWMVNREGFSHDIIRRTIFSVTSVASTTGYTSLDYTTWAPALQLMLLFTMGLGVMAGSTGGGFKTFRLLTVLSFARQQVRRQLHPRIVGHVKLGAQVVPDEIVLKVLGFFGLFMASGALATFLVALSGADIFTSISTAAAAIGNIGVAAGEAGPSGHFLNVPRFGRAVLAVMMLVGRLEIFPVLLGVAALASAIDRRLPPGVSAAIRRRT